MAKQNELKRRASELAIELREVLYQLGLDPAVVALVRRHFKVSDGHVLPDGILIREDVLPLRLWDLHLELDNLMCDPAADHPKA
ncbi:MAG: hypothetical protein OXE53_18350 [Deltaproteobacteria bacterium]|nr:hypothetical protein [Deltaproteobacteria bacterium]